MARKILVVCCGLTIAVMLLAVSLMIFGVIPLPDFRNNSSDPRSMLFFFLGFAAVFSVFGLMIFAEEDSKEKKVENITNAAATVIRETPPATHQDPTIEDMHHIAYPHEEE